MSAEHIITLANGKQFAATDEQTLLDAALAAGLPLEHSCRTGRCGSCKVLLLAGQTRPLRPDSCLSEAEHAAGWVLSCTEAAETDVSLDAEDLSPLQGIAPKTLPARIARLERLADDVLRVVLRLPPNAAFRYLPGQYVNIIAPGGLRRSYSIANAEVGAGQLEFYIRQVDGGALSAYWFERAQANDLLRLDGPRGSFYLRDVAGARLIFLATGTGIAPIKALLEQLSRSDAAALPASVELLWGGRQPADLFWTPETTLPALNYTPVLSRADAGWNGARGHVQDVLLAQNASLAGAQVYACGSSAMIESAREQLQTAGLARKSFHSDAFVSSDTA
nr:2Fe-2S iron-sulfur cluster-binding protein [uncultured Roseateles sp.]